MSRRRQHADRHHRPAVRRRLVGGMFEALDCLISWRRSHAACHFADAHQGRGNRRSVHQRSADPRGAARLRAAAPVGSAADFAWRRRCSSIVSLYLAVARPMARLMRAMIDFRNNPEDPSRIARASSRRDEIGRAERELATMQGELYGFLQQKARLAALGAAVAKIQHDLRNILSSAQLASDRLAKDRRSRRAAPGAAPCRLARSCRVAGDEHAALRPRRRASARPPHACRWRPSSTKPSKPIAPGEPRHRRSPSRTVSTRALEIDADPEQLYRIVLNLVRNAAQAFVRAPGRRHRDFGAPQICARWRSTSKTMVRAFPKPCANICSSLSRVRAGPAARDWASPSRAISPAPMAATSRSSDDGERGHGLPHHHSRPQGAIRWRGIRKPISPSAKSARGPRTNSWRVFAVGAAATRRRSRLRPGQFDGTAGGALAACGA